jgi:uncharacterized membrane protein
MNEKTERAATERGVFGRDIAQHIFGNAPTLLALCLTVIGLIKIYASLQRITTLADNLLLIAVVAFLVATIFSYLALRSITQRRRVIFGDIADGAFLLGLCLTTCVALFITFTLAG